MQRPGLVPRPKANTRQRPRPSLRASHGPRGPEAKAKAKAEATALWAGS